MAGQQPMDNMKSIKLSLRECLTGVIVTDFILFFSSPVRKVRLHLHFIKEETETQSG